MARVQLLTVMLLAGGVSLAAIALVAATFANEDETPPRLDPAAWGDDHVGKETPEYVTGDECLFCHRKIGPAWGENRHQLTIRPADPDSAELTQLRRKQGGDELAAEVRYLMGDMRAVRFLKRSKAYGKLELLSASLAPASAERDGVWRNADPVHWETDTFSDRCAGCHTTAVNDKRKAFAAVSLDCFACHGDVDLAHTKDTAKVLLSEKSREPRQVISICGQCHLRGGKSKSSERPYPNTFVAGDNLFRDFQIDFSAAAIEALPAGERHIFENAREVALFGRSETTCLSCHEVHRQVTNRHQSLKDARICSTCHVPGTGNSALRESARSTTRSHVNNKTCDY